MQLVKNYRKKKIDNTLIPCALCLVCVPESFNDLNPIERTEEKENTKVNEDPEEIYKHFSLSHYLRTHTFA